MATMTLADVRNRIMTMEVGEFGWDLRDECLALVEIVSALGTQLEAVERRCERLAEGTGDWREEN